MVWVAFLALKIFLVGYLPYARTARYLKALEAPRPLASPEGGYRDAALREQDPSSVSWLERWRAERAARRQLAFEARLEAASREELLETQDEARAAGGLTISRARSSSG